jgi:two-component system LytT family sensor kinase
LLKYRVLDVLIWASIFFLWREYYKVVDPPPMSWIFACISTSFAGVAFYFTYLYLVPFIWNKKNIKWFLVAVLITLAILAPLRSASIYVAFETRLPGFNYWRFFNSITASTFHIGYAITIAALVRLFVDRYEIQKKMDAISKDNLQTELNYLKSQVNPHFLFNIHNSIYFLIEENPKRAAEVLLKLSGIVKFQLYDCNKETIPLRSEIDNIRNYIELEKMRIEEAVHVEFQTDVTGKNHQIAPFMLLPIIENAFKHVSQSSGRRNEIKISISQQDEWLHLQTVNTIENAMAEMQKGLGIKNAMRRLALLYPGNHELHSTLIDGNYVASLKLKLQE